MEGCCSQPSAAGFGQHRVPSKPAAAPHSAAAARPVSGGHPTSWQQRLGWATEQRHSEISSCSPSDGKGGPSAVRCGRCRRAAAAATLEADDCRAAPQLCGHRAPGQGSDSRALPRRRCRTGTPNWSSCSWVAICNGSWQARWPRDPGALATSSASCEHSRSAVSSIALLVADVSRKASDVWVSTKRTDQRGSSSCGCKSYRC